MTDTLPWIPEIGMSAVIRSHWSQVDNRDPERLSFTLAGAFNQTPPIKAVLWIYQ